jgi:hypothetical protein
LCWILLGILLFCSHLIGHSKSLRVTDPRSGRNLKTRHGELPMTFGLPQLVGDEGASRGAEVLRHSPFFR